MCIRDRVYIVVERKGDDSPVYEVKPESGGGRTRVLHRNHLFPCDFIQKDSAPVQKKPQVKHRATRASKENSNVDCEDVTDSSDEVDFPTSRSEEPSLLHQHVLNPNADPYVSPPADHVQDDYVEHAGSDVSVPEQPTSIASTSRDNAVHQQDGPVSPKTPPHTTGEVPQLSGPRYPTRTRQPPAVFTYDQLGHPSVQGVQFHAVNVPPVYVPQFEQCSSTTNYCLRCLLIKCVFYRR
ncbi:uncharacterized protein LOC117123652 [Anneissia japonica]|uniref:uncharacterized protein LOC117123652 n=1 Tax=Anneissia japonica TaxID=1529436 RepID=UPI0014258603|nr:uncharacterized protein LOC117123652 [Anneissia japonica]